MPGYQAAGYPTNLLSGATLKTIKVMYCVPVSKHHRVPSQSRLPGRYPPQSLDPRQDPSEKKCMA